MYGCLAANDTLENVSVENVAYVANILRKKYGRPGEPKEELVFEVYYYIPDHVVSLTDRAELVAKLIVNLQRSLPMEGMLTQRFPDKVERGYLDRVREFLPSEEGKYWSRWHTAHVDPKNPAANRVQLGVCFSSPRTAVLVARWGLGGRALFSRWLRSVHPRLYSPPGYNPVAMMPDASLNETTMRPMSAMGFPTAQVVLFLVSLALMVPCLTMARGLALESLIKRS